ncbi:Histidinol-phosphatase [Poriferisphaera corsica]|uniref:Histidinol-phosphatase n=1 Tax=Poriferisphaera corsica TaxID=2528020 RepID=A0A517YQH5_9BACT|nr:histidinol-phosphatase [Poriferisphaera corsica]QDU32476.1 Histidinol-phosphatase [Poriferisphaera corsica]
MAEAVLYETHTHTTLCKHATGTIEEYAERAVARGMKGLTVTCHNPLPDEKSLSVRMREDEFDVYLGMVEQVQRGFEGRLDVLLGMEFDYAPEFEGYLGEQVKAAGFDYCLGSIHPQTDYYCEWYHKGDAFEDQKTYFDMIAKVAECGMFDCVSHPDLIKIFTREDWDLERVWPWIEEMLDRVEATGVAMELNTSGEIKVYPEFNPSERILGEMQRREIPVVIGSDAHAAVRVGDRWEKALRTLAGVGYTEINYYKQRERVSVGIDEGLKSLVEC